ncbi:hypothetical protein FEFB_13720 [Fructobacillus sp. EFB-N1]|uniref:hypothetical protein n=1 Tax=Fructobacillus sp. EFB-N1 TaxID=1658766 RepID=UPI00064DCE97|nr:hypothetical protein [Fructobacillus sp. EFB-N1]KMK52899.1 hypothetical protein FEFB_13720 [Fructobacillus sp. EFB-N1]
MEKYIKVEKIKIFRSINEFYVFLMMNSIVTAFCFKFLNRNYLRVFLLSTSLTSDQISLSIVFFFISLELLSINVFVKKSDILYNPQSILGFAPMVLCTFTVLCISSALNDVHFMKIKFYTWQIMLYSLFLSLTIFELFVIVKELIKPYLLSALDPRNEKSNERIIAENINNIIMPFIAVLISLMALIFR